MGGELSLPDAIANIGKPDPTPITLRYECFPDTQCLDDPIGRAVRAKTTTYAMLTDPKDARDWFDKVCKPAGGQAFGKLFVDGDLGNYEQATGGCFTQYRDGASITGIMTRQIGVSGGSDRPVWHAKNQGIHKFVKTVQRPYERALLGWKAKPAALSSSSTTKAVTDASSSSTTTTQGQAVTATVSKFTPAATTTTVTTQPATTTTTTVLTTTQQPASVQAQQAAPAAAVAPAAASSGTGSATVVTRATHVVIVSKELDAPHQAAADSDGPFTPYACEAEAGAAGDELPLADDAADAAEASIASAAASHAEQHAYAYGEGGAGAEPAPEML